MNQSEKSNHTPRTVFWRRLRYVVLCFIPLVLTGCATSFEGIPNSKQRFDEMIKPTAGTIVSTREHKKINEETLLARITGADVVYLGEKHDNTHSHNVQLKVIKNLLKTGRNVSIGFELFRKSHQPLLDQWSRNDLSLDQLRQKLKSSGHNPKLVDYYGDILDFARKKNLPLVGLKPSRKSVRRLVNHSRADTGASGQAPNADDDPQRKFLRKLFREHPSTGHGFRRFVRVQQFWERKMAGNIHRSLSNSDQPGTMVVLTGNLHVLYDFGIPEKLSNLDDWVQLTILTLPETQSLRETFELPESLSQNQVSPADYVWWVKPTTKNKKNIN